MSNHFSIYSYRNKWKPGKFEENKVKVLLIIFGTDGKDIMKLKETDVELLEFLFWLALNRREAADDFLVLKIDEYKTSSFSNQWVMIL